MSIAKLHINLTEGNFQVEGEESFVREMYAELKDKVFQGGLPNHMGATNGANPKKQQQKSVATNNNEVTESKKKKAGNKSDEPKIDKELDLSGINGAPSLKDFVAQYQPSTNLQRNVVFIEYLKNKMGMEKVTIHHVWTCYHEFTGKLPINMKQSLYDTSAKTWISVSSTDDLSLSVQGKNWLREQLNKPKAA